MKKYSKKAIPVQAIQIVLDVQQFTYLKWGGMQTAKSGDWLVLNEGEVYTVGKDTFAATYIPNDSHTYIKVTPVWAEEAVEPGRIKTKEGETVYAENDWLVYNNEDETDGYAMSAEKFHSMYEEASV